MMEDGYKGNRSVKVSRLTQIRPKKSATGKTDNSLLIKMSKKMSVKIIPKLPSLLILQSCVTLKKKKNELLKRMNSSAVRP